jgi:hypothetical protein
MEIKLNKSFGFEPFSGYQIISFGPVGCDVFGSASQPADGQNLEAVLRGFSYHDWPANEMPNLFRLVPGPFSVPNVSVPSFSFTAITTSIQLKQDLGFYRIYHNSNCETVLVLHVPLPHWPLKACKPKFQNKATNMFPNSGPGGFKLPSNEPASAPKITRGHSCVLCFQRKVKCDGQRPCSTCVKAQVECIAKAPTLPRRRKAQISKGDLLARLRRCEELLEIHGVKVEDEIEAPRPTDQHMTHSTDDSRSPESTADIGKLVIERGHSRYFENDLWSDLGDEVRFLICYVTQTYRYLEPLHRLSSCPGCSIYNCAPSVLLGGVSGVAYQACDKASI